MKALEAAIKSRLAGDATLMGLVTAVKNTVAPSSTLYPFLVFQKVAAPPTYTFTSLIATNYLYQFRVIGNDLNKDVLNDALARVKALLNLQPITVTGYRVDRVTWDGDMPDMAQDDEGQTLLQVGATYRFYVI